MHCSVVYALCTDWPGYTWTRRIHMDVDVDHTSARVCAL